MSIACTFSYTKKISALLGTARTSVGVIPAYSPRTPCARYICPNTVRNPGVVTRVGPGAVVGAVIDAVAEDRVVVTAVVTVVDRDGMAVRVEKNEGKYAAALTGVVCFRYLWKREGTKRFHAFILTPLLPPPLPPPPEEAEEEVCMELLMLVWMVVAEYVCMADFTVSQGNMAPQ